MLVLLHFTLKNLDFTLKNSSSERVTRILSHLILTYLYKQIRGEVGVNAETVD